jgi:uncharacterized RmlC-like cupin family protein
MKALSVGLSVAMVFFVLSVPAQNPPKQEKLIFENEYVRAYEVTLNPGESLQPHETGNRLIYSLSTYVLRYHWDNKVSEENRKPGDVHFHPAGVHHEENSGKQKAIFLIVERTSKALPAAEGSGRDMAKASPYNSRLLLDREQAKIFEVTLYPKDAVAMHFGLNRIVYGLTSYELFVRTPDGKEQKETHKKGSCEWHAAGMHTVENRGSQVAKFVVFSFKK